MFQSCFIASQRLVRKEKEYKYVKLANGKDIKIELGNTVGSGRNPVVDYTDSFHISAKDGIFGPRVYSPHVVKIGESDRKGALTRAIDGLIDMMNNQG